MGKYKVSSKVRKPNLYKMAAARILSQPVKTAIVRAVRRANPEEVKFATLFNSQMASNNRFGLWFNGSMDNTSCYNLVPEIPQGVNIGQRIGNKISPRKLVIDFWVTAANLSNNLDFVARLLVLQSRKTKDAAAIAAASTVNLGALLDYGQGEKPFEGYTSDLSLPINKEEFTVMMDRKLTLDKTYGYNPAAANVYSSSAQGQSQGIIRHIRVTLKCPATLHYALDANLYPDGWAPFFNAGYVVPARNNAAGDSPDTIVTGLSVQWNSTLFYTDA